MKTQLDMYRERQDDLVKKYNGKIIAVKDGDVLGVFPTKTMAFDAVSAKHAPGTFIIIKCTPGDKEYTRRFRSRAVFNAEARL